MMIPSTYSSVKKSIYTMHYRWISLYKELCPFNLHTPYKPNYTPTDICLYIFNDSIYIINFFLAIHSILRYLSQSLCDRSSFCGTLQYMFHHSHQIFIQYWRIVCTLQISERKSLRKQLHSTLIIALLQLP